MIHCLITRLEYDYINISLEDSMRTSSFTMMENNAISLLKKSKVKRKPPISLDHYMYIAKNMINPHLDDPEKF